MPAIEIESQIKAVDFDLSNLPDDYFQNPRPYFRALRDDDPFHTNRDGSILVTRYQDIMNLWRDLSAIVEKREHFTQKFGTGPLLEHHTTTMLFRDPPDHDRLRNFVNPFFTPSNIKRMAPAIEQRIEELIASVREKREIDFVQEFSLALTTFMICLIIGIPYEESETPKKLGTGVLMPLNPDADPRTIANGHQAVAEFKEFILPLVNRVRAQPDIDPGRDMISALVAAERGGLGITEDEILHMCILIFNGGHESTANLLSVSMKSLIESPESLDYMRSNDLQVGQAIEELMRFVSPLQLQGRRTTRTTDLPSGTLEPGSEIIFAVGSANWDERAFDNPDTLNLRRSPNSHITFGAGVHSCIGRPLAKLEATLALPAFVRAFPKIEQTGAAPFRRVARFRGIQQLPVRVS
jgi:cytochrome P450